MNLVTRSSPESCLRILFETRTIEDYRTAEYQSDIVIYLFVNKVYRGSIPQWVLQKILFENPDTTSLFLRQY